jgi:hypothetical protein
MLLFFVVKIDPEQTGLRTKQHTEPADERKPGQDGQTERSDKRRQRRRATGIHANRATRTEPATALL